MAEPVATDESTSTTNVSDLIRSSDHSLGRMFLWRWLGYFAVFAITWHVTNLASLERANFVLRKLPFVQVSTIVLIALLIHGGWRVVPAACGGLFAMLVALTCWQYWGGDSPTAAEIWEGTIVCAPFGIATGGIALEWQRDHGKQWKAVAMFLLFYGLVTAGFMLSFLCSVFADEVGRSSVR